MDPAPRRRPVPPSYSRVAGSSLAPDPPPPMLRPSRSATNLKSAHRPPETGVIGPRGELPVGFVVDDLPTPGPLAPRPNLEVRRAKSSSALSTAAASFSSQDARQKDPSKWKAALGEAQYFAGGLISRPAESTRHFTVIRHTHALVWYRGPSTSVSITIMSDQPLPANRTVWLQQKGFSGNMGMNLKALVGTTGSWIDVTPANRAAPEHIPEGDERGIQRDLKRFFKKASGRSKHHVPRETHVVRIPAAATDGYFRLIICGEDGKKVLCGCPVFRIASTSTDAAVVRGAGLRNMPLEVGVKVASTVGQQVVKRYVGVYAGVAGAVVQSRAKKLIPTGAIKRAGQTAYRGYQTSGMGSTVEESWKNGKAGRYDPIMGEAMLDAPVYIIGSDVGPEAPFPIKFYGRVETGTGRSTCEVGIPTANLSDVSDAITMRLSGVFAAWAMIMPNKGLEDISDDWHEAIVTIAPLRNAAPGVALRNRVTVNIIYDFDEDTTFFEARVKIVLMGHLHPAATDVDPTDFMDQHAQDTMTTLASLGRENWAPEETIANMKGLKSERSFNDRLNSATGKVQQHVDKIPLHWAGVRSESGMMRDQTYGKGGMWIPR